MPSKYVLRGPSSGYLDVLVAFQSPPYCVSLTPFICTVHSFLPQQIHSGASRPCRKHYRSPILCLTRNAHVLTRCVCRFASYNN
jgi:hypothetical protein